MPTDDRTPDLSKLEHDYQILTELHHSTDSRTYLARHLGLNRDVTISIVHAGDAADHQMLTQFAADTRALAKARHPNVIPVIEGRRLDADTFAVVRARVRGSTLDHLLATDDPLPLPRASGTLSDIHSALEWARKNGIMHREVSADDVVFQQGSSRVLLAFNPAIPIADAAWDRCADARTIGRLAWEMLAGRRADAIDRQSLAQLRPDLPERIVDETNALMNCRTGAAPNVPAFIALLAGSPLAPLATKIRVPGAPSVAMPIASSSAVGESAADDAVVVVKHGLGFNARVATAAAVLAVLVIAALLLVHQRGPSAPMVASQNPVLDTTAQAAGEVVPPPPIDTAPIVNTPPQIVAATPAPAPQPVHKDTASDSTMTSDSMIAVPARRHEPGHMTPPLVTMPNAARSSSDTAGSAVAKTSRDSASGDVSSGDMCNSPRVADQRSCLTTSVAKIDAPVHRVYQELIAALRLQAGADVGDPDPPAVTQLREAQTKWLGDRAVTCSDAGMGPLYAKERARCFGDEASKRLRELQEMLDEIPK